MTKASISLQELRRKIYVKAKADKTWRFWGLYVHVCKKETLREAFRLAKKNNGAPGIDGVTFEAIVEAGVEEFLEDLRFELVSCTYMPMRNRAKEIPKGGGKVRTLGIPTIRDRVVQGALKLILEPIFESDFQKGSFGYRPGKTAHEAVARVARAVVRKKTRVIDLDLRSFFDTVRHDILLGMVAKRVDDDKIMRLLKLILKAGGKRGVPQGGVISPLLSNVYLNGVDKMLENAIEATRDGEMTHVEYARYADDLVVLVREGKRWLLGAIYKRLMEELNAIDVELNEEKTRIADLSSGESFRFLGFDFRRARMHSGKAGVLKAPGMKARTSIIRKLKEVFRRYKSQPVDRVINIINPILRGWLNYFRVGNSKRCFDYIRRWVEMKVRRHLMRVRKRGGYGWKRWSKDWLYENLGLYGDYKIEYYRFPKALPAR